MYEIFFYALICPGPVDLKNLVLSFFINLEVFKFLFRQHRVLNHPRPFFSGLEVSLLPFPDLIDPPLSFLAASRRLTLHAVRVFP